MKKRQRCRKQSWPNRRHSHICKDFLAFYRFITEDDLKEHWDADEDQDWEDGEDLNGDGRYTQNQNFLVTISAWMALLLAN